MIGNLGIERRARTFPLFRKLNPGRKTRITTLCCLWHFRDEFVKREKAFIDNGGKLIFRCRGSKYFPTAK